VLGKPRISPRRADEVAVQSDACAEGACGLPAADLDESDPLLAGWVRAEVLGSEDPPRLYCSASCAVQGLSMFAVRVPREVRP
jgi:hypothetical protein